MSRMRQTTLFLVAFSAAIGMLWLAHWAWNRSGSFLADTWRNELERVPEREVDLVIERICNLGEEGISALVTALGSQRECVSRAAAKAIRREHGLWSSLPPEAKSLRPRRLAEALVEAWPRLEGPSRRVAVEVVSELVSSGFSGEARKDAPLLAACAEVLRSATLPESSAGPSPDPATTPPNVTGMAAPVANDEPLKMPATVHAADSILSFEQISLAARTAGPAPLPSATIASKPLSAAGAAANVGKTEDAPKSDASAAATNEPRRLPDIQQATPEEPGHRGSTAVELPRPADISQLADQLNDGDPQRATAARQRLGDLGWSAREIEVAKRARHPDPAVRRALAHTLPDVAGMDAAPWLLELSRDPDSDVRLEAMTLLATTGDPALVDTVRKLAAADADERIQKLAARLGQANASVAKERSK